MPIDLYENNAGRLHIVVGNTAYDVTGTDGPFRYDGNAIVAEEWDAAEDEDFVQSLHEDDHLATYEYGRVIVHRPPGCAGQQYLGLSDEQVEIMRFPCKL